jgi:hypothetical protein
MNNKPKRWNFYRKYIFKVNTKIRVAMRIAQYTKH